MQVSRGELSQYQLIGLAFSHNDTAASQSDVQLKIIEAADPTTGDAVNAVDEYVVPFDGEVIAISGRLSAAATAGQLTVGATVNGTEDADSTQTITTAQNFRGKWRRGSVSFVAGDRIGCEITTNGTWDGTTADLIVTVWVLYKIVGI